ncbi:MAG: exonuclease SbcCD subunit D C-terminal domain-containing protein [Candidatus Sericytochromatia bacterium]|nr:exonuclease SbcCD subunit D C-terminal domain-containing protein [Candidatus Sericytochromatia bacterium]
MKLLHTSDWHLGRTLYGKKRYDEFDAFLNWLIQVIEREEMDALIIAGDIFDTTTPSNRAQELYYNFLARVAACGTCRHIVIVAGNHDSPTFLNAPRDLLRAFNVHVVGHGDADTMDEQVLVLRNANATPEMIVCAVPYLRDKDLRTAEAGESIADKERKLVEGIRGHYARVAALAEQKKAELGGNIPVVVTGHLFTAGGHIIDGDGVRDLYIGSLAHVTAGIFSACFDYVALGHLHVPQRVGGSETIRYSGSPIPMGFGEAKQQKSLSHVQFRGSEASVRLIQVPCFQPLERIQGDWEHIKKCLDEIAARKDGAWVEVIYEGAEVLGDLRERLETLTANRGLEILRVKNNRVMEQVLRQQAAEETLEDLGVHEVFARCLDGLDLSEPQRMELLQTHEETLASLRNDDARAE